MTTSRAEAPRSAAHWALLTSPADLDHIAYRPEVRPQRLRPFLSCGSKRKAIATFPVRAGLKWLRTYHATVSTPVRVGELVAGILAWCGVRVIVAVTIFAVIAAVGGAFVSPLAVLAPFAALLCGLKDELGWPEKRYRFPDA